MKHAFTNQYKHTSINNFIHIVYLDLFFFHHLRTTFTKVFYTSLLLRHQYKNNEKIINRKIINTCISLKYTFCCMQCGTCMYTNHKYTITVIKINSSENQYVFTIYIFHTSCIVQTMRLRNKN